MIDLLAPAGVLLTGSYLVGLAAVLLLSPARAMRFLGGFAGSAAAHYGELVLRLLAGGALLVHAPRMRFSGAFVLAGWVLVLTTAALLAVPWQWHRRFAAWTVPRAVRHPGLLAAGSFLMGGFVLASLLFGADQAG